MSRAALFSRRLLPYLGTAGAFAGADRIMDLQAWLWPLWVAFVVACIVIAVGYLRRREVRA